MSFNFIWENKFLAKISEFTVINRLHFQDIKYNGCIKVNSFPASEDFCCLLIAHANSLYTDQAHQNAWPDLDLNPFLHEYSC